MTEQTQPTDEVLFNALKNLIVEAQAFSDDHHRPRYARLDKALASARNALLGYWATPQPTKAQAKQITAQQSYDAGFSNGWDRGVAYLQTQTKAGSVPMTDSELVRRSRAGAIQTDDSGKVVLRPTHYRGQMEARFRHGWREAERHHCITKEVGQHDDR